VHIADLQGGRADLPPTRRGELPGRRAQARPAWSVEARASAAGRRHRAVERVGGASPAEVVDGAVVEELPASPVAALVAAAAIAVAVVDAAVVADVRAPVAGMEQVGAVAPAPPRRGPIEAHRRDDPGPRHPVVVVIGGAPGPVARRPDVAGS